MSLLLFVVVLPPVPQRAIGQISLPTDGMTVTRSFDSFDGSGFSPAPSEGQLDSENFVVTGLSDGDLSFGDVATSGDFARGGSGGGVTIGGIYAFETATGNFSVGVQPTGSDFTPGAFVAQYRNDTEGTVTSVDLTYEINVFNDAQRANSFEAAYAIGACGSTPDGDFSSLPSLDYTTPGVADGSPSWSSTTRSSTASVNLSAGECLFLRFTSDDVSGSGSRDEIALDGLSVTPQQAPRVRFTAAGGSVSEADGSTTLTAEIVNPDGNPVSVDVAFASGSSASQGDFTSAFPSSQPSTSLTFPSGASDGDTETIALDLAQNDGAEGMEVAGFNLQNLSTSGDAAIGPPSSYDLTIRDAVSEHQGDVLITELMPAPSAPDTEAEYVELYNSTASTISSGTLTLQVGGSTTLIDTLLPARGFVVLCRNTTSSVNGGVTNCDQGYDGSLTDSGQTVQVLDANDTVVDAVTYDDAAPWPDANGAALVFTGTTENDDGANWTQASRRERGFSQGGRGSGDAGSPGRNGTGQTLQPTTEISGEGGWRMLSAPMGNVNADTLAKTTLVQGVDGHSPSAVPNLYQWPGGTDDSGTDWTVPSSATTDLTSGGQGFIWYVFGAAETPRTDPPPFTLGLPGTPRTSDVTTDPLGDGFHLLGNPYAQSFDLSALNLSAQGFQTTVQVWDPSAGSYVPVTQSGTSEDVIGAYQGFFVECTASTSCSGRTVTFSASGRRADPIDLEETEEGPPRIDFLLVGWDGADSVRTRDRALMLHAPDGATAGWDVHDASKLTPLADRYATAAFRQTVDGTPRLSSVVSIPHPLPSVGVELPLSLQTQDVGSIATFQLRWPTWEHVPDRWSLTLHDAVADSTVNLRIDTSYVFSPTSSTARANANSHSSLRPSASVRPQAASDSARFTLTVQPNPIPVELAALSAATSDRTVRLSWTTISETDNAGFHVDHRGPKANQFSAVGFVDGHGTSDSPQHYRFRTDPLGVGRHVFRLRQVDLDGSVTRSDTVAVQVRRSDKARVTLAPNPVRERGSATIRVRTPQQVDVALYDVLGRRVRTLYDDRLSPQQPHSLPIRAEGLSSGSYLLRVKGEHFRTTRRVTVVR